MTNTDVQKVLKVSHEFDCYVARHPDVLDKIPNRSVIFHTVKGDTRFNKMSRNLAEQCHKKGEKLVEIRKEGKGWSIAVV